MSQPYVPQFVVELRDPNRNAKGQFNITKSASFVFKENNPDTFDFVIPSNSLSDQIEEGWGIIVSKILSDKTQKVAMAGPMEEIEQIESVNDGGSWHIVGQSDDALLEDMTCWPGTNPNSASYDAQSGTAETVMQHYVNVNGGPGTGRPERQIPGLTLGTNHGYGTTVLGNARFEYLGDYLRYLANQGGDLVFGVLQSGTDLVYYTAQSTDRSSSAIFSFENDNLEELHYFKMIGAKNFILGAGTGDLTARTFVEISDPVSIATWNRRREEFYDYSSAASTADLNQASNQELLNQSSKYFFQLKATEGIKTRFLEDYFMSDVVGVDLGGQILPVRVREVDVTITDTGAVTTNVFPGDIGAGTIALLKQRRQLRHIDKRVSLLERH